MLKEIKTWIREINNIMIKEKYKNFDLKKIRRNLHKNEKNELDNEIQNL